MRSAREITWVAVALGAALAAAPAAAQSTRTATIAPGKPARLAVVTSLKKDCSVGDTGSIRVTAAPKNGSIVIRGGKLKTPASFRCPNVDTPVQALFYEPRKNFTGTDEIAYETRSPDGETQTFRVRIDVTSKPASGKDGILDL